MSSSKSLKERFQRLDGDTINFDCEFLVGPQSVSIKGHKLLFASASDVFQSMFYGNLKEEKAVKVEDLDPEGFKGMKQFIYSDQVEFTSAIHALYTYLSARKYIVPGLCEECIKYLEKKLQPSEVLELYEHCKVASVSEFDELCYKTIRQKTDEVLESEYFLQSDIETIELILKSQSLKLKSEMKLFFHFERWALAEADRKNMSPELIKSSFNMLKKHIRFLSMSLEEFNTCALKSSLLTPEEKIVIINNLTDINSVIAMPEYLSPVRQHREFYISPVVLTPEYQYKIKHLFTVSFNEQCRSNDECILTYPDISFKITCSKINNQNISFQLYLKTLIRKPGIKEIYNNKSRIRLLATEKRDNLYFEDVFYVELNWDVLGTRYRNMFSTTIPIENLNIEKFLLSNFNIGIIEASFNFELEH